METADILASYYRNPHVRRRILDFLGGKRPDTVSCRFITADDPADADNLPRPIRDLVKCLDAGMGIARSLWDRESFLADLDIEYVNFDFAAEPYLRPTRMFELLAPVVRVTRKLFQECQLHPLHLFSGRGHHFVWRISRRSEEFASLVEIGAEIGKSDDAANRPFPFGGDAREADLCHAFAGLALVMEHLVHEIKRVAAPLCDVPVELTAVEVGPGDCGREMISLDISEYGDPLRTRAIRVPFSIYLKPLQQLDRMGKNGVENQPPIFVTPLPPVEEFGGYEILRDMDRAISMAKCISTRIPRQERGMARLIALYLGSPLRQFHDWFYSCTQNSEGTPDSGEDHVSLESLPHCARFVLDHPNDLLLRPWSMRLVTRSLLALGWHPRHIAGLIRCKFQQDFGWGDYWKRYDPAMRADFYTRVFAGLFVAGCDDLVDFNCQSSKEERTCPLTSCPDNLEWFRDSALARRRYGYLAHRPVNGLFLPEKHLGMP